MHSLSHFFSAAFPAASSGAYNISAGSAHHRAASEQQQRVQSERDAVLSTLDEVSRHLGSSATPAACRLRHDVDQALRSADLSECSGAPAHLPSLAQAQEWLLEARFDERVNPGALTRLRGALAATHRQWQEFELPQEGPLSRSLHQLRQEVDAASTRSKGQIDAKRLHQFDQRLEALKVQALDFVADRGAMINARLRSQQLANATLPPGCPYMPPLPRKELRDE
ncbi:hypothetical protein [Roseateles chitinivorans]|uniref:hypothetical protein n=1 Tax=Roseateles chitinivorans TaxID=2917965 RepID=UPI003D664285